MLKEFLTNVMRVVIGPVLGLIAYVIFAIIVTAATYTWL
jgi:phage shock protein PspC (stress-responsive transcriptional regulator)